MPEKAFVITLVRSAIGRSPAQRATVRALGLKHLQDTVRHRDTPQIRGMIRAVSHLVTVQAVDGEAAAS